MMYRVVDTRIKTQDEFIELETEDRAEAIEAARSCWFNKVEADQKNSKVEIRAYESDSEECYDYDLVEWRLWYAVEMDAEDNDWGTGSYDLDEAKKMAEDMGALLVAVIDRGICIHEIEMYDEFRVSAIFEDGTTVDNDLVQMTGEIAVEAELEEAREWFADRNPESYMVSYYRDGECIRSEVR